MTPFLRASYTVEESWVFTYMQVKASYNLYILLSFFCYIFIISHKIRRQTNQFASVAIDYSCTFFCMSDSDSFFARHTYALWCYGAVI